MSIFLVNSLFDKEKEKGERREERLRQMIQQYESSSEGPLGVSEKFPAGGMGGVARHIVAKYCKSLSQGHKEREEEKGRKTFLFLKWLLNPIKKMKCQERLKCLSV